MILNTEFFRANRLPKPNVTAEVSGWMDIDPETQLPIDTYLDLCITVNNVNSYPEGTVFKCTYFHGWGGEGYVAPDEYWETFDPSGNSDIPIDPSYANGAGMTVKVRAFHDDYGTSRVCYVFVDEINIY